MLLPANVLHVIAASAWIGGIAVLVARAARRDAAARAARPHAAAVRRRRPLLDRRARVRRALLARRHPAVGARARAPSTTSSTPRTAARSSSRACSSRCCSARAGATGGARCPRSAAPPTPATRPAGPALAPAPRAARRGRARPRRARGDRRARRLLAVATRRRPGPFSGSADLGPARAELTVEPALAGPNEVHLYFFDRADGAPVGRDAGAHRAARRCPSARSRRSSSSRARPARATT